jgi:putative transposase
VNSGWGYDRTAGALANLGHSVSDQTVGNELRRHGISPAPKRTQTTTWKEFVAAHMAVLSGIEFFCGRGADLTRSGHVLRAVCHPAGNTVTLAGFTRHPAEEWMQ